MKEIILIDKEGNKYSVFTKFSKEENKLFNIIDSIIQERIKDLSFIESANLLFPRTED